MTRLKVEHLQEDAERADSAAHSRHHAFGKASGSKHGHLGIGMKHTFHIPNTWPRSVAHSDDEEEGEGKMGTARQDMDDKLGAASEQQRYGGYERDADTTTTIGDDEDDQQGETRRLDPSLPVIPAPTSPGVQRNDTPQWEQHATCTPAVKGAVLCVFALMGAAVLLPFNTLITPAEYYRSLLKGSNMSDTFMSWLFLTYNVATIALGAHATITLHKTTPARRVYWSSAVIWVCLLVATLFAATTISDGSDIASPLLLFTAMLLFTVVIAGSTAYLQNAVVSLCAIFGGQPMGLMLAGQGMVGLIVSLVQLWAASYNAANDTNKFRDLPTEGKDTAAARAATIFFAFSTAFMSVASIAYVWLARLRLYRSACQGYESAKQSEQQQPDSVEREREDASRVFPPSPFRTRLLAMIPFSSHRYANEVLDVQSKILSLSLCIFYIFVITLAAFPAITARVISVDPAQAGWQSPLVFVAVHFVCFNASDLLGRALPSISARLTLRSSSSIVTATIARTLFIPLFFAFNIRSSSSGAQDQHGLPDWLFFLTILAFGFSNGFTATSTMISGPGSPVLTTDSERALAGALLSFWLTLGLAAGSVLSFALAALV